MKAVVALGGNALGDTPQKQLELVKQTAKSLAGLIEHGNEVIISHGNGPQVGQINIEMNYAAAHNQGASFPLPECGAMSQGYIGYHLQQSLQNELNHHQIAKNVLSVVTQVAVSKDDPAFKAPSKPVGGYYDQDEANQLKSAEGYQFTHISGKGWRRVVPSPVPQKIIELPAIKQLMQAGNIVIAGGGGGIPVLTDNGQLSGVPAVIDKDLTSALLATKVNADCLIILTTVDYAYRNYNQPDQTALKDLSVNQAIKYMEAGNFGSGSMLPKIKACIEFVQKKPEGKAIITSLANLDAALAGKIGTQIHS